MNASIFYKTGRELLEDDPLNIKETMIFYHPAHFAHQVMQHFHDVRLVADVLLLDPLDPQTSHNGLLCMELVQRKSE